MATFKSDKKTSQDSINIGGISTRDKTVIVARGKYTVVGTEAAADVIKLVTLPAYAEVIPALSYFQAEDPGTALVGQLGYSTDVDALQTVCTLSSGGNVTFVAGTAGVEIQDPVEKTANYDVQLTIDTATALTAGAELQFYITYLV